jgi:hypothetical protein
MNFAMWLLQKFGVPERNESLIGDLIEERAAGRSTLWLWGQSIAAIADTVTRDLRDHWVLALRAIGTGWAATFLIAFFWEKVATRGFAWHWKLYRIRPWGYASALLLDATDIFVNLVIWPVALGWVVAQTHPARTASMVLALAASVAFCAPWVCVQCVPPDAADPSLLLACSGVLGVLVGGLLPQPRKRTGAV